MAAERARKAEVLRYYQPWLETFHTTDLPLVGPHEPRSDGYEPRSSTDKALTAFAQLGCLRLQAKRGIVTLIGSAQQYILAEATKTLSLIHDTRHSKQDELWFGNAVLPRGQGISEDALCAKDYTTNDVDGKPVTRQALVVPDIAVDKRYAERAYAGSGISFYAGVPINTSAGFTIGVYNITDDKPRSGLSGEELRFMTEMASVVMDHLATIKNDRARARGEKLIQGIGAFIAGKDGRQSSEQLMQNGSPALIRRESIDMQALNNKLDRQSSGPDFKGLTVSGATAPHEMVEAESHMPNHGSQPGTHNEANGDATPVADGRTTTGSAGTATPDEQQKKPNQQKPHVSNTKRIFERAASILLRCMGADGVVFLDATSANLNRGSASRTASGVMTLSHAGTSDTDASMDSQNESQGAKSEGEHPTLIEDTNGTNNKHNLHEERHKPLKLSSSSSQARNTKSKHCEILGSSFTTNAASYTSSATAQINDSDLRRLVRRYPDGKWFSFDRHGKLNAHESSDSSAYMSGTGQSETRSTAHPKKNQLIFRALPDARNAIFVPLFDYTRNRWSAGLLIWSTNSSSLMNAQEDISYLKAFGGSIMGEIARENLSVSDSAKATFLANISHELRSPLHGILGSIEFLHETATDDFQAAMLLSVEVCGKTLLDTVNHVLDYAKLNNLSSKGARRPDGTTTKTETYASASNSDSSLTDDIDLALCVEEAVEAVYVGQVFRTANKDAIEEGGPTQSSAGRAMQSRETTKKQIKEGSHKMGERVHLSLDIEHNPNWRVVTQPGAIRRLVMNLLGNSLKYTDNGSISVSLAVDHDRHTDSAKLPVCITVADTGRGMSEDFISNHAFTAFSQEDSLSAGTGLGLSIVRSIVNSLDGRVDLESQKDVGTVIKIWLVLPVGRQGSEEQDYNDVVNMIRQRTNNLRICFLEPENTQRNSGGSGERKGLQTMPNTGESLRKCFKQWFGMSITTASSMSDVNADVFIYAEPPPIEYLMDHHGSGTMDQEVPVIIMCTNAFESASLRSNGVHHLTEIGRIIEIISQPLGPQKLAKVLLRCLQRAARLEDDGQDGASGSVELTLKSREVARKMSDQFSDQQDESRRSSRPPKISFSAAREELSASRTSKSSDQASTKNTEKHTEPRPTVSRTQSQATNPDSPRVLVVDDNQINLHLLVTFVRKAAHPYEAAQNGLEALETYKKSVNDPSTFGRFRYIFMDISMPVMDGMESARQIRAFERENNIHPPVTIVALTGLGSEGVQEEATRCGFSQFMTKPIKFKNLKNILLDNDKEQ